MMRACWIPRTLSHSAVAAEGMDPIFDSIPDALNAIRNGECVVVVDDERRENEGDLIYFTYLNILSFILIYKPFCYNNKLLI